MPIFEYYCADCHTVFQFFAPPGRAVDAPGCPRCARHPLERKPSRFATLRSSAEARDEDDPLGHLDDEQLDRAMEGMMRDLPPEGAEDDPRALGRLMRGFSRATGLELGDSLESMVQRLERGEDPERIEQDMGALDDADLDTLFRARRLARQRRPPIVDDELHFL